MRQRGKGKNLKIGGPLFFRGRRSLVQELASFLAPIIHVTPRETNQSAHGDPISKTGIQLELNSSFSYPTFNVRSVSIQPTEARQKLSQRRFYALLPGRRSHPLCLRPRSLKISTTYPYGVATMPHENPFRQRHKADSGGGAVPAKLS